MTSTLPMPSATVIVATRNRKDELRRSLASVLAQSVPVELIVLDDNSSDGTADLVRTEFPSAILDISTEQRGCIVARNDGAKMATTPYIFSIDDDAEFSTPYVVEQTLRDFSNDRVAAVAIPYYEPHKSPETKQAAPNADRIWLTESFVGTAYAIRADLFRRIGGFVGELVHLGEETDLAIRLLDAGYVIRLGTSDPIIHYESPRRDYRRMDWFGSRNPVLFAWRRVPLPNLPLHMLGTSLVAAGHIRQPGRLLLRMRAILSAYRDIVRTARRPVAPTTYRLSRELRHHGPLPLDEVAGRLPQASL